MSLSLTRVTDPHCGRASDEVLQFEVDGDRWHVEWGRFDAFGSPAYWIDQTVRGDYVERVTPPGGEMSLVSETVFCLLGGYGVTAESATAAHEVVMETLVDSPRPEAHELEAVLRRQLPGGLGRYRFPRQRARRVALAVASLGDIEYPSAPAALRDSLLELDGIGPKTASWIVRNVTGSMDVAIIDIWLVRALQAIGVFPQGWRVERHYRRYEATFLQYAALGDIHAGALDLCIWEQARIVGACHFDRS
jgi:thermostable 8-oxoguanine DNA glycosylase